MALHARGTILHLASVMHGLQSSISAFTKAARCKYKGDLKEAKSGLDNNVFVVHLPEWFANIWEPALTCLWKLITAEQKDNLEPSLYTYLETAQKV